MTTKQDVKEETNKKIQVKNFVLSKIEELRESTERVKKEIIRDVLGDQKFMDNVREIVINKIKALSEEELQKYLKSKK